MNESLHTSRVLHQYYHATGKPALDPATIALIAKLVFMALSALWDCYQDEEDIARAANRPGVLARWRLRRLMREVPAADRAEVYEAFLAAGRIARPEDFR